MNRSMPGLPVYYQLPEFTQTHAHRVSDAIQPSHPLSSPSPPAPNSSQRQGLFQWVNSLHEVAKVLEFQLQHQSLIHSRPLIHILEYMWKQNACNEWVYPLRLLQFSKAEMRLVARIGNGRFFTSLNIKEWGLLTYEHSYFEQIVESCLTWGFDSSWFKTGFMDIERKMVMFCVGKLVLRKIKHWFVTFPSFSCVNAFSKDDLKIPKWYHWM